MTDSSLHLFGNLMFASLQLMVASAALLVSVFFLSASCFVVRNLFRRKEGI